MNIETEIDVENLVFSILSMSVEIFLNNNISGPVEEYDFTSKKTNKTSLKI